MVDHRGRIVWLVKHSRDYLRWAFSLSRKIVRIAPFPILLVVISTLVSQLSIFLASLLPLKIILLIGSSGIPRYFPGFLAGYGREPLILGLSVATVGFYILHLLGDRVTSLSAESVVTRVIERTGKLPLFVNQEEIARDACRKLARTIAAAIFAAAVFGLIAFIHPTVAMVLAGWWAAVFLVLSVAGSLNGAVRSWLESHAPAFITSMSNLCFFAITVSIVAEFLLGAPFNILYAVISLILSRQLLQRISTSLKDALALSAQKPRLNALFFFGHPLIVEAPRREDGVWSLCRPERLANWLPEMLGGLTGRSVDDVQMIRWRDTGLTGVLAFEIEARYETGKTYKYLVKLFGEQRRTLAARENALLSVTPPGGLPCLPLLGTRRIENTDCFLFKGVRSVRGEIKGVGRKIPLLARECWLFEPPAGIVHRYRRSHQLLAQRLTPQMSERLTHVALTSSKQAQVRKFEEMLEPIQRLLERMPLTVHNPDITADSIIEIEDGKLVATEWGRWSLEPVGIGWPAAETSGSRIAQWLETAKLQRQALANVTVEQIQLAALAYAFQRCYARQRYGAAMRILPALLACAERASAPTIPVEEAPQEVLLLKKTGS